MCVCIITITTHGELPVSISKRRKNRRIIRSIETDRAAVELQRERDIERETRVSTEVLENSVCRDLLFESHFKTLI